MPELPEVETVKNGLESALIGAVISGVTLRRSNLRTPFPKNFEKTLTGRKITAIKRRAKYLLFYFDNAKSLPDIVLIAHLGMTGRFSVKSPSLRGGVADKAIQKKSRLKKDGLLPATPTVRSRNDELGVHDHVIFDFNDGRQLIYNDPRRFGLMELCKRQELEQHKLFVHLAPEPLEEKFTPAYLQKSLSKRETPIKPTIMDQKIVVGVGNIYANEALFMAGISPLKPANTIGKKIPELISCIHSVLNDAIKAGGSTLKDFAHVSGESGYFQHNFHVYGREGKACSKCKTAIISIRQAGRATFYCPKCQK
ncbi:MAG: bifunctional DNA-formamidopyrimidine glycosylase/DNA-(apurinic or apyrimidinic site) lyase [Rickettsiales bacterium]